MATRFCPQCGQPIEGDMKFCTNCGASVPPMPQHEPEPQPQQTYTPPQAEPQPVKPQPTGPKPNSFLVLAILTTIFCCLPFGIVAIVQAAKVDSAWAAGQYAMAEEYSKKARNWSIISAVTGIVVAVTYTILMAAGIVAAGNTWASFLNY